MSNSLGLLGCNTTNTIEINSTQNSEDVLTSSRLSLFPIEHDELFAMYKVHLKSMWTPDEIDFSHDASDFKKISSAEQNFILHILAFFAGSDTIVMENLSRRFCDEIKLPEARSFYAMQMFIENIHNEVYERMIMTLVESRETRMRLLHGIKTIPSVGAKAQWAQKWIDGDFPLGQRILAFVVVEGVFFSGSFCAIFWLRHRGILNGLIASNDFIARDETLHTNFGIALYNNFVKNKLEEKTVHAMFCEAVEVETSFITAALPVCLPGMSASDMTQYIKFVADHWLRKLNCAPLYNVKNPFTFMVNMALEDRTNFFERRNTTYTKANTDPMTSFHIMEDGF